MPRLNLKWLAIVLAVAASFAGGLTYAQAPFGPRDPQAPPPRVLSGNDLGFRVEGPGRDGRSVTGKFVVRIDGEWIEVVESGGVKRLTAK